MELALQIDDSFRAYGRHLNHTTTVLLGGVSANAQIKALRKRPDILIATPGRLLDLHGQGHLKLDGVEFLVLDEADRMLDMGFIHDVRKIIALVPRKRQTMLFSATMPDAIVELAASMLQDPARVSVTPPATVAGRIKQNVFFVKRADKRALLSRLLKHRSVERALVFTRTKHRANRIMRQLCNEGLAVEAIHSNKSQNARQRALSAFDNGDVNVLIATDIMARGIDVDGITHVINYELPNDAESYVHRIGRTARAGADGIALSFCDADELSQLRDIEKLTRCPIVPIDEHPFHAGDIADSYRHALTRQPSAGRKRGPRRSSSGGGNSERQKPRTRSRSRSRNRRRQKVAR